MNYTLLTAAHIRRAPPRKMDAAAEQEYYEAAAGPAMKLERVRARFSAGARGLAKLLLLIGISVPHGAHAKPSVVQNFNESNNAS